MTEVDMAGAGTELGKLIPGWATRNRRGCQCKNYAKIMDKNGVQWCREHREDIVRHLMGSKKYLARPLQALPSSLLRKTAEKLVDQAIANASR